MEKERLQYTISRFDLYFSATSTKMNLLLTVNALFTGLIIFLIKKNGEIGIDNELVFLILLSLITGAVSVGLLLYSTLPFLDSNGNSLLFFDDIVSIDKSEFKEKSRSISEEDEIEDFRDQVYYLAKGLNIKYRHLRIAVTLFFGELIILTYTLITVL